MSDLNVKCEMGRIITQPNAMVTFFALQNQT